MPLAVNQHDKYRDLLSYMLRWTEVIESNGAPQAQLRARAEHLLECLWAQKKLPLELKTARGKSMWLTNIIVTRSFLSASARPVLVGPKKPARRRAIQHLHTYQTRL